MLNKTISFAIPCYNSAEYMDKCISYLIKLNSKNDDIEILIIDDGSTKDNTLEKAKSWENNFPNVCKAIHQENGGHGQAVNTGLKNARGLYFKVVDSDDWLDIENTKPIIEYLRSQVIRYQNEKACTDLVIGNYVYNKVSENKKKSINYKNVFPTNKEFGWDDVKHFHASQFILMHSVIYRTQVLKDIKLELPKHTFYVDNIFVYVPLPSCKTMYYIDTDMYMYYIGREDQSVNETVMMSRMDQQLRITKIMFNSYSKTQLDTFSKPLSKYMISYLSMMLCICNVFLRKKNTKEDDRLLEDLWVELKETDKCLYKILKNTFLCKSTHLHGPLGKQIALTGYSIAQKLFNFN